jgi:hypothetical protein
MKRNGVIDGLRDGEVDRDFLGHPRFAICRSRRATSRLPFGL